MTEVLIKLLDTMQNNPRLGGGMVAGVTAAIAFGLLSLWAIIHSLSYHLAVLFQGWDPYSTEWHEAEPPEDASSG